MCAPGGADPRKESRDRVIAEVARSQQGVFTVSQALEAGFSRSAIRHRLDKGAWERLASGVLGLAGASSSWARSLFVAQLGWGTSAVLSHRCAAALWPLLAEMRGTVELTVPRRTPARRVPGIVHRRDLPEIDVTTLRGLRITTPVRTLIDLSAVVPAATAEEALDEGLRLGLFTLARVRWRLADLSGKGYPGSAVITGLIEMRWGRAAAPRSRFETRLFRALRAARLPMPELQHEARDTRGKVLGVLDFAWPDLRLGVEAAGFRWHGGRARWQRDLTRGNGLALAGWTVLQVTWEDLTRRRDAMVETIVAAVRDAMPKARFPVADMRTRRRRSAKRNGVGRDRAGPQGAG